MAYCIWSTKNLSSTKIIPLFIITAIIFIAITKCEFQKCTPRYCLLQKCPDKPCKGDNKILFHNVTTCGCCNECVEELG